MKSFDILSIREYFPSPENPSASTWVYNQAKGIQQFNTSLLVLSPTPQIPTWLTQIMKSKHAWKIQSQTDIHEYNGVKVMRPPFYKLPNKYFFDFNIRQVSNCILKQSEKINFKLIHAHFGHAGVASLPLKKKSNKPLITSFYGFDLGSDKDRLRKYYKNLSSQGDLFLALSDDMANDLTDLNFPSSRVVVHHLGVDVGKFALSPEKNKDIFTFTIVASFVEKKGIQFVIAAFKTFMNGKDSNKFQLRLVGDGEFYHELKSQAMGCDNIIFVNNFITNNPRETVAEEMRLADVFLLTSVTSAEGDKEGTPIVLMEAQACGKPCISSFHAGIPEVVINGVTGTLVEERDITKITEAMELLFSNKTLRLNYAEAARNHINKNFNNNIQIELLNNIYKKFII